MNPNHDNNDFENDFENLEAVREWLNADVQMLELPSSLLSENLLHLLTSSEREEAPKLVAVPKKNKPLYIKYGSYAACFAIMLFGFFQLTEYTKNSNLTMNPAAVPQAAPQAASIMLDSAAPGDVAGGGEKSEEKAMEAMGAPAPRMASYAGAEESFKAKPAENQPTAKNYEEIINYLMPVEASYPMTDSSAQRNPSTLVGNAVPAPAPMSPTNTGGGEVYSTNTQIAGVDEADIIKTDGRYIYQYRFDSSTGGAEVNIVGASNLKKFSTIPLEQYSNAEMYLIQNKEMLVLVRQSDEKSTAAITDKINTSVGQLVGGTTTDSDLIIPEYERKISDYYASATEVLVYDIADKVNPKQSNSFSQAGKYISSRVTDDMLYLVTRKDVPGNGIEPYLPATVSVPYTAMNSVPELVKPSDIMLTPRNEGVRYYGQSAYAVVSAIEVSNSCKAVTKAVLGNVENIMMNKDSLFLTNRVNSAVGSQTGLVKFVIDGTNMSYVASAAVDGNIDNQFSLDEYKGNLRIATTFWDRETRKNVNNVYVLDKQLAPVGNVSGLAPGESIKSVRFMEDVGYVVTFRQTDPLFVIDLSNPKSPVVKGELKIPGFSEYLHPIDKNTLVGIGVNMTMAKDGNVYDDGLKLSLFDVSDPTNPKETSNLILGNRESDSPALRDHRAVMYYPEKKLMAFPVSIHTTVGGTSGDDRSGSSQPAFGGLLVVKINADSFSIEGKIENSTTNSEGFMRSDPDSIIERGIYVGETLYAASSNGISAFSIADNYKQIGSLLYKA